MSNSSEEFWIDINCVFPSQLYINVEKLNSVQKWFDDGKAHRLDALPVKIIAGGLVLTDGHTRAVAAYLSGAKKLKVYWDNDELDWRAYEKCVGWCNAEGVGSLAELSRRIIEPEDYRRLWLERCRAMHEELGIV